MIEFLPNAVAKDRSNWLTPSALGIHPRDLSLFQTGNRTANARWEGKHRSACSAETLSFLSKGDGDRQGDGGVQGERNFHQDGSSEAEGDDGSHARFVIVNRLRLGLAIRIQVRAIVSAGKAVVLKSERQSDNEGVIAPMLQVSSSRCDC